MPVFHFLMDYLLDAKSNETPLGQLSELWLGQVFHSRDVSSLVIQQDGLQLMPTRNEYELLTDQWWREWPYWLTVPVIQIGEPSLMNLVCDQAMHLWFSDPCMTLVL